MKDKIQAKKYHEGYSDVSYEDICSANITLAHIIAKHLRAFLKAEKGPWGGTPGYYVNKYGEERGQQEWHNAIRKMIYAFEEHQHREDYLHREKHISFDIDNEEDGCKGKTREDVQEEERQKRIREGMQLFIDHFDSLWI